MVEIGVAWVWESNSPLHVGSGLSRLGVADSLVQRDPARNAVIYGEAVKGALRMGAEQVAAWLGASQEKNYASQGTAEPCSWPLARLFGGEAVARCTPAMLVENGVPSRPGTRTQVFTSTAIDRATGTARESTLRKTEIVPRGLRFGASYRVGVIDGEVAVVETLLTAALTAVETIGGKAGIGWGRMSLRSICVEVDGCAREPSEILSPERLESLRREIMKSDGVMRNEPEFHTQPTPASNPTRQKWFKLMITLEEPTCLPDAPEISNKVTTNDGIAATTLRGALAGYWRRSGHAPARILSWLSDETAWTPAFRVVDSVLAVPAPRSFVTTKRPLGDTRPVHDTLAGEYPTASDGSALQWRSIAGDAILGSGAPPTLAGDTGLRETRMHVARDYRTGSKRSGALYARESLIAGTTFVFWARVPESAFEQRELTLLLGKRISAGNGRAAVRIEEDGAVFGFSSAAESSTSPAQSARDVTVQLMSPALVYDSDTGYPLRTLDLSWWSREFDEEEFDEIEEGGDQGSAIRTAPGRRGGWMTNWRHARAAVTTIAAGSVWRLRCRDPEAAKCLRKRLRDRKHIGERSHEGFGWIAVDPPWFGGSGSTTLPAESPAVPKASGEHMPWPGISAKPDTLAGIARRFAGKTLSEACNPVLQELAARLRAGQRSSGSDVDYLNRLKAYCDGRSKKERERSRPARWRTVMKTIPDELWTHRDLLLFALGILISRGSGAGE